eukprot:410041-Pelagomonas_calceolata.AAC.1
MDNKRITHIHHQEQAPAAHGQRAYHSHPPSRASACCTWTTSAVAATIGSGGLLVVVPGQ